MVAPNGIFVMTKNLEKLSRKNFNLKNFSVEPIGREIHEFLSKGVGLEKWH